MRHRRSKNRLNQKPAHARMLKRNLVTSLLLYEKLRTTKKRAQVIAPEIDKLVTYAKNRDPQIAIRKINAVVTDKNASRKIMEVYVKRYAKRASGLTRITPAGARVGDNAQLVDITLIDADLGAPDAPAANATATEKKPAAKKAPAKKKAATKTTSDSSAS